MNPREKGFLLLGCSFGNPDRKVLTGPQLRALGERVKGMERPETDRDLEERDLLALGYGREMAGRILCLLAEEDLLEAYLRRGRKLGCVPVTRVSDGYPAALKEKLGLDAPACIWARGDLSLLDTPAVALVGSRDIGGANREFAGAVGRQAARQGYALVSGNARGADKTGQEACLRAGGRVISVVADRLADHRQRENVLFLSEDGFDAEFSAWRALSRNRLIHALGRMTFVAQCTLGHGGTWDGTVKNLSNGWSPVRCFNDGSEAARELADRGAEMISMEQLQNFGALHEKQKSFFDQ